MLIPKKKAHGVHFQRGDVMGEEVFVWDSRELWCNFRLVELCSENQSQPIRVDIHTALPSPTPQTHTIIANLRVNFSIKQAALVV